MTEWLEGADCWVIHDAGPPSVVSLVEGGAELAGDLQETGSPRYFVSNDALHSLGHRPIGSNATQDGVTCVHT